MGRYFALTLDSRFQAPQPKKRAKIQILHIPSFGKILVAVLIVSGIFYLLTVNSSSTKGYEIKRLEQTLTQLKEQNARLELEAASQKSIQNLEQTAKILNLVPSNKVDYAGASGYAYEN